MSILLQALAVDDMSNAKEMVDDYMERNQEDFDEFSTPDDVYEEILQDLDSLEVSEPCLLQKSLCAYNFLTELSDVLPEIRIFCYDAGTGTCIQHLCRES